MTVTQDAFLGGRLILRQPRDGFRAGSDAVLLAAACPAQAGQGVLDLGCGVGTAMYCLAARVPGVMLTGVERDAVAAELARQNGTADIRQVDAFDLPADLRNRQWHHVICNPPYWRAGAGKASSSAPREAGLREGAAGDVARWAALACRRVAPGGSVTVIAGADRLAELLGPMSAVLGDLAVLPIASRAGRAAGRVLVRGRLGARGPLTILPPLVMHGEDGETSPSAEDVLRNMAELALTRR